MIGGLVTQQDVADELSLECGVVIVGSGPAGRPWPRNWPRPGWTWL